MHHMMHVLQQRWATTAMPSSLSQVAELVGRRGSLWRPCGPRRTQLATTVLAFSVRLGTTGVTKVRLAG